MSTATKLVQNKASITALESSKRTALMGPATDFWLLGGASLLLYVAILIADIFRHDSAPIEMRLAQLPATFLILNFVCNYPHFLISFKFAYERGGKFIVRNWFPLIVVPVSVISLFAYGFFSFREQNNLGKLPTIGLEVMSAAVWLMYATVGWHYAKQVFGCVMVYGKYTNYPIQKTQRLIFKLSLFSAAIYQFVTLSRSIDANALANKPTYSGIFVTPLGLPEWLDPVAVATVTVGFVSVLVVFADIYRTKKKLPHPTLVVAWLSIFVWWVSPIEQIEYLAYAVPFFHSLQYLPFAYKMESQNIKPGKHFSTKMSFRLVLLVIAGFLVFELLPSLADIGFDTGASQMAWFFTLSIVIFINIHHFFIDSVVWKFSQPQVQKSLF